MDSAAFATWRVGNELLNSAQRSLAYQDLALAEANDVVEYRDDEIDETAQEDRAEAVREGEGEATPEIVAPAAVGPSPAPDLLSKVGDGRIANFGCPHCGGQEVGCWGRANGRPRYCCKECRKTSAILKVRNFEIFRIRESAK